MKNLTTFVSAILLVFSTTACSQYRHTEHTGAFGGKTVKASKNYVTKNIKVDNFTGLNLAGSPDVIYTQKAGKPEVAVYTSDNIVDLLDINVANNTPEHPVQEKVSMYLSTNWRSASPPKRSIASPLPEPET